jgi:hypothetical protein
LELTTICTRGLSRKIDDVENPVKIGREEGCTASVEGGAGGVTSEVGEARKNPYNTLVHIIISFELGVRKKIMWFC